MTTPAKPILRKATQTPEGPEPHWCPAQRTYCHQTANGNRCAHFQGIDVTATIITKAMHFLATRQLDDEVMVECLLPNPRRR